MEAIRTRHELYVEKLLNFLEIPHEIHRIICFECDGARFYCSNPEKPEQCPIGLHTMHRGQFCRPDFVLAEKKYPMPTKDRTPFSVLRVDGGIHDRGIQKKKDRGQERSLRDLHIPYFVSLNSDWDWEDERGRKFLPDVIDYRKIPPEHLNYLLSIWVQTLHSSIYKKYGELRTIRATKLI